MSVLSPLTEADFLLHISLKPFHALLYIQIVLDLEFYLNLVNAVGFWLASLQAC